MRLVAVRYCRGWYQVVLVEAMERRSHPRGTVASWKVSHYISFASGVQFHGPWLFLTRRALTDEQRTETAEVKSQRLFVRRPQLSPYCPRQTVTNLIVTQRALSHGFRPLENVLRE